MKPGQRFAVVAIFATLGPAAGAASLVIAGVIWNIISRFGGQGIGEVFATLAGALLVFVFSLIIAYPAAVVSATVTGVVMAGLAGRVGDLRLWLALGTTVGAVSAFCLTGWPFYQSLMQHDESVGLMKAGAGAFAGCVSAAVSWPVVRERRARSAPSISEAKGDWPAG